MKPQNRQKPKFSINYFAYSLQGILVGWEGIHKYSLIFLPTEVGCLFQRFVGGFCFVCVFSC